MLSPHPNPKTATVTAVGLIVILAGVAYGFARYTGKPGPQTPPNQIVITSSPIPYGTATPVPTPDNSPKYVKLEATTSDLTDGWSKFNDSTDGISFEYPTELTFKLGDHGITFQAFADADTALTDSLYYNVENIPFSKDVIRSPFNSDLTAIKIGTLDGLTSSYGDAGCASTAYFFPVGTNKLLGSLSFGTCSSELGNKPQEKPVAANAKQHILSSLKAE